jgi:hypothetical protein
LHPAWSWNQRWLQFRQGFAPRLELKPTLTSNQARFRTPPGAETNADFKSGRVLQPRLELKPTLASIQAGFCTRLELKPTLASNQARLCNPA